MGWDRYGEFRRKYEIHEQTKKKEAEIQEYENLEKLADSGNPLVFYKNMWRIKDGFKTGASSFITQRGAPMTDAPSIRNRRNRNCLREKQQLN